MKKKLVTTLMMAMVATTLFGTANLTAEAKTTKSANVSESIVADPISGVTVANGVDEKNAQRLIYDSVFDAEYYAQENPDVVAALGNDPKTLFAHYLTNGIKEGRNASATFNFDAYTSANPDLVTAFGSDSNNIVNYFLHYTTCGKAEGRITTTEAATASGITVTSFSDPTKVVATPTVTGSQYAASSNGASTSSAGTSNNSSSSNNNSSSSAPAATSGNSTSSSSGDFVPNFTDVTVLAGGMTYSDEEFADLVEQMWKDRENEKNAQMNN